MNHTGRFSRYIKIWLVRDDDFVSPPLSPMNTLKLHQSLSGWVRKACYSPGLGLEKHPPMVGPGMKDAKEEGGRDRGEGGEGVVRCSGLTACWGGNSNAELLVWTPAGPRWPSHSSAPPYNLCGQSNMTHRWAKVWNLTIRKTAMSIFKQLYFFILFKEALKKYWV